MSDRPSDGFTFDELREEYEWMSDFMGRMTERIRGNADVHSLAAYAGKLEAENAKLRELAVSYDSALRRICDQMQCYVDCHDCILGKDYGDDSCAIDELREAACVVKVELE